MNPEKIYTNYRNKALAKMFTANEYQTFVAMPFRKTFSYRPTEILSNVIQKSVKTANGTKSTDLKEFSKPQTVENEPLVATVINDKIVEKILDSHFFLADLTGENPGVLLETGIAIAFKPNSQIILITQDKLEELHFDIRNNGVIEYNNQGYEEKIANAFLEAARSFEKTKKNYLTHVSEHLSPDAINTLIEYGSWYQIEEIAKNQPGLWKGTMPDFFKKSYQEQALTIFNLTLKELLDKEMIWSDFAVQKQKTKTIFASHATNLGWLLIKHFMLHFKSDLRERLR